MDKMTLVDAIYDAGFDVRSYSGRCMYGDKCVAFVVDGNVLGAVANIVVAADDNGDAVADAFNESRMDSMGRGTIVYFPLIAWDDDMGNLDDLLDEMEDEG